MKKSKRVGAIVPAPSNGLPPRIGNAPSYQKVSSPRNIPVISNQTRVPQPQGGGSPRIAKKPALNFHQQVALSGSGKPRRQHRTLLQLQQCIPPGATPPRTLMQQQQCIPPGATPPRTLMQQQQQLTPPRTLLQQQQLTPPRSLLQQRDGRGGGVILHHAPPLPVIGPSIIKKTNANFSASGEAAGVLLYRPQAQQHQQQIIQSSGVGGIPHFQPVPQDSPPSTMRSLSSSSCSAEID